MLKIAGNYPRPPETNNLSLPVWYCPRLQLTSGETGKVCCWRSRSTKQARRISAKNARQRTCPLLGSFFAFDPSRRSAGMSFAALRLYNFQTGCGVLAATPFSACSYTVSLAFRRPFPVHTLVRND